MRYYFSLTKPKRSDRLTYCDVCGFEYKIKDVHLVRDSFNRQNGLLVCKPCKQKTNSQDKPYKINEVVTSQVEKTRNDVEIAEINLNDDRGPGIPTNGFCRLDSLSGYVTLYWTPPSDQGSSPVSGYIIQRSSPQGLSYSTLISNTGTGVPSYVDETAVTTTDYSYKVAAINSFATGSYSAEFYWPVALIQSDSQFLLSEPDVYLIDENGNYLLA